MRRHAFPILDVDGHEFPRVDDLHLLSDEPVGHGVVDLVPIMWTKLLG